MKARVSLTLVLSAVTLISACGVVAPASDRILFDGMAFRAKAKPVDKKKSPTEFTVTVNNASASLDGAREAGRYEGIKFCIQNFGSSRINWAVGPETEPQKLRLTDDKLTFLGKCQRP